jgi:hypothetical protein
MALAAEEEGQEDRTGEASIMLARHLADLTTFLSIVGSTASSFPEDHV